MSKMGISTYQSYCGAQIFDAVGLRQDFVDQVFHWHAHAHRGRRAGRDRGRDACAATATPSAMRRSTRTMLDVGGDYAVRVRGEDHVWTAETVSRLQHAVRGNSQEHYRAFARS